MIGTSSVKSMYLILKQHHFFSRKVGGGGEGGDSPQLPRLRRPLIETAQRQTLMRMLFKVFLDFIYFQMKCCVFPGGNVAQRFALQIFNITRVMIICLFNKLRSLFSFGIPESCIRRLNRHLFEYLFQQTGFIAKSLSTLSSDCLQWIPQIQSPVALDRYLKMLNYNSQIALKNYLQKG